MTTIPTPPPVGYLGSYVEVENRKWDLRHAADWDFDPEYGWAAPCSTTELEWLKNGWPLPEDPGFAEWFEAFHHHDALDEDVTPVPYPHARS